MDQRIAIAAAALPKLAELLKPQMQDWINSPAEIESLQEELFYDPRNGDVYLAISITMQFFFQDVPQDEAFIARIPLQGEATRLTTAEILELELEDISHLAPSVANQLIHTTAVAAVVKSVLKTSMLMNDLAAH